jgi:hypothetical protein
MMWVRELQLAIIYSDRIKQGALEAGIIAYSQFFSHSRMDPEFPIEQPTVSGGINRCGDAWEEPG